MGKNAASRNRLLQVVFAGAVGGSAAVACEALGYRSWIMFLVWTAYALFGKRLRSGLKMYASFCAGVVCGFAVGTLEDVLRPHIAAFSTVVGIGLAIALLSLLENDPPLDDVPAYFLGAIAFYATEQDPSLTLLAEFVIAGALGVAIGWLTVAGRGFIGSHSFSPRSEP